MPYGISAAKGETEMTVLTAPLAPTLSRSENRPDDIAREIPNPLSPDVLRDLSRLNPWRSTGQIVFEWTAIIGAVILCEQYWHPVLYLLTVIWIGARQHALGILMHDGSHARILRAKGWNDAISEVFLSWPIFVTMRGYRKSHIPHHRYLDTDRDPDWVAKKTPEWEFPKSRLSLALMLLKDLSGLNAFRLLTDLAQLGDPGGVKGSGHGFRMGRLSFYILMAGIIGFFGLWQVFLLFWLVPLLTWFKVITHLRSIAEHFALEYDSFYTLSRTTYLTLFERFLIAPNHINYHVEHHLYPGVPFYRLPKLHRLLMEHAEFRKKAHTSYTYLGVLQECANDRRGV